MRLRFVAPVLAAFALTACGEDTTRQAEQTPPPADTAQPAPAPAPATRDTTKTAQAPIEKPAPAPTQKPADTALGTQQTTPAQPASKQAMAPTGDAGGTGTAPETTGATGAAATVRPGTYESGKINLTLQQGGKFTMAPAGGGGETVSGKYVLQGSTLILSDATGQAAEAVFPMRCQVQPDGKGFRVEGTDDSCKQLQGQVFRPQG
jgi:hypothetical protein